MEAPTIRGWDTGVGELRLVDTFERLHNNLRVSLTNRC